MTTDISLKALRETVEVIDALIIRLQELNAANLSLKTLAFSKELLRNSTDLSTGIPRSHGQGAKIRAD